MHIIHGRQIARYGDALGLRHEGLLSPMHSLTEINGLHLSQVRLSYG